MCCLCGLIWQFWEISANYFKFEVVSNIGITMPGSEKRNSLNICFDTADVIDVAKLKKEMNSKYQEYIKFIEDNQGLKEFQIGRGYCKNTTKFDPECLIDRLGFASRLTIAEKFEITHRLKMSLNHCLDYMPTLHSSVTHSPVTKFVIRDDICYNLNYFNNTDVSIKLDGRWNELNPQLITSHSIWASHYCFSMPLIFILCWHRT